MKKILSLFVSVIMMLSAISFTGTSVYAANYDSIDTACYVNIGTTYYGTLATNNWWDYYRISLDTSGCVIVSSINYTNGGHGYYYLYDYQGNLITYWTIGYNRNLGYANGSHYEYLKSGVYYLKATNDNGVDNRFGDYQITVDFESANESFKESYSNDNDLIGKASTIALNKTYTGQIGINDWWDYYEFKIPTAGTVTISSKNYTSGGYGSYYLYNDQGNLITYWNNGYNSSLGYATGSNQISLTAGTYYLKVTNENGVENRFGQFTFKVSFDLNLPKISSFKVASRKSKSLKLKWSKVSGISGYQVQKKKGDSWKTLIRKKDNYCTNTELTAGKTYKYRVRVYKTIDGTKYYGSWKYLTACTKPKKVKIKSPSSSKSEHKITVKWEKVGGYASGYQIVWARDSSFDNVVAKKYAGSQNKTSYVGKNFTKGKRYYVKVRAYKVVDGKKYYGYWSDVKSIKAK